ncbi:MAG: hypothetical protein CL566_03875 [Alphaproteobacteria bacterium]|nr:hypothetical protein [Alphaproteobacteria bacterium]
MGGDIDHPASAIIDAFGGIRPMAGKLDVPVSTVQGWKQRDSIPSARMEAVRSAAADAGITLPDPSDKPSPSAPMEQASDAETAASASKPPEKPAEDDKPPSYPTDSAAGAPPARRGGGGLAVLALLISLAAAGWIWWTTAGPGAAGGENGRISVLEGRVARLGDNLGDPGQAARAELSRDLEAPRARIETIAPPGSDVVLAPLREQLTQLRAEIERLDASPPAGGGGLSDARLRALEEEIQNAVQLASTNMQAMSGVILEFDTKLKALADRLDKIGPRQEAFEAARKQDGAAASQAVTLALAASQLRRDLFGGAPFRAPLDLVRSVAANDPGLADAVATLAGSADAGVTTLPALLAGFAQLVPGVLAGEDVTAEGDLLGQLTRRAREIVRIRRTGADVPGNTTEARLARAEFLLNEGDVDRALEMLATLASPARDAIQPWIEQAQAHVAAHGALATIESRALQRLQGESGTQ